MHKRRGRHGKVEAVKTLANPELEGSERNEVRGPPVRKEEMSGALLIITLSVGVYWDSLDYEFVHDDVVAILRNPDVRPSSPWKNLLLDDFWGTPMSSTLSHKSYRPLTVLTFRLNYVWSSGGSAFWFHFTNILIHASVSVLLLFLSWKTLRSKLWTGLITSAIFALHPIHTEAVAGITGRSDALACLLMLISFLLYSQSLERNGANKGKDWALLGSGISGALAMLAKETGLTVLGINVAFDLYIHIPTIKRWVKGKGEGWTETSLRRRLPFIISIATISLIFRLYLMNGSFPKFGAQDNPAAHSNSSLTRFLTYGFLPVFNFWLILCPHHLSYDWQMGSIPLLHSLFDSRNLGTALFYPLLTLLFTKTLLKEGSSSWRKRRILTATLFITLPFLPASNLLFPVGFVAAERVLYTPSLGVSILTAEGFEVLKETLGFGGRKRKSLLFPILILFLLTFGLKTSQRNGVWKSRGTLFESGLQENPKNAKVHYNYGNLLKDSGNWEGALKHYKAAVSLWPDYTSAWNNLGAVSKDPQVAEQSFLSALKSNPHHGGAHFNLGVIYMRSGRVSEALEHLEQVVFRLDPMHIEALEYLGACYISLNKTEEAGNVFQKLISTDLSLFHSPYKARTLSPGIG